MATGVDTSDLDRLRAKLDGLEPSRLFLTPLRQAMDEWSRMAQQRTPRGPTGRLRRGYEPAKVSVGFGGLVGRVPLGPFYAKYVIGGTRHMAPQDFVRDTWPQAERRALKLIVDAVGDALR